MDQRDFRKHFWNAKKFLLDNGVEFDDKAIPGKNTIEESKAILQAMQTISQDFRLGVISETLDEIENKS